MMYKGKSKILLPGQKDYSVLKTVALDFLGLLAIIGLWYVGVIMLYGITG